jgi:beta-glucosidase
MAAIAELIAQMTLEEKAALCTGASAWTTTPIERLGIPALLMTDGPHGVRRVPDVNLLGAPSLPATCFPTASALAASWDTDLLHELGQALAEEAIALEVDLLLGPGVNMKRSPLCGRNFEYFAEDPYLAGELAVALINGIQSKGVVPRSSTLPPTTRRLAALPSVLRLMSERYTKSTCRPLKRR